VLEWCCYVTMTGGVLLLLVVVLAGVMLVLDGCGGTGVMLILLGERAFTVQRIVVYCQEDEEDVEDKGMSRTWTMSRTRRRMRAMRIGRRARMVARGMLLLLLVLMILAVVSAVMMVLLRLW
jgi:hypothetical protein